MKGRKRGQTRKGSWRDNGGMWGRQRWGNRPIPKSKASEYFSLEKDLDWIFQTVPEERLLRARSFRGAQDLAGEGCKWSL